MGLAVRGLEPLATPSVCSTLPKISFKRLGQGVQPVIPGDVVLVDVVHENESRGKIIRGLELNHLLSYCAPAQNVGFINAR